MVESKKAFRQSGVHYEYDGLQAKRETFNEKKHRKFNFSSFNGMFFDSMVLTKIDHTIKSKERKPESNVSGKY